MSLRSENGHWLHQDSIRAVQKFDNFTTIDWMEDELAEHQVRVARRRDQGNLAHQLVESTKTWLLLAIVGVVIGVIAASLNVITSWLSALRLGYCSSHFYLNETFCCWRQDGAKCGDWATWSSFSAGRYLAYIFFSAVFSGVAAVLVKFYSPAAAGSGISEIKCIVSGFVVQGFLGPWTLLIKSLGLPLAIASGLSLGKEGPSVHYAVCVGSTISTLFSTFRQSASKHRDILTASAAAGVAVAFGSPMGGVLFAMEEISSVFHLQTLLKSYVCAFIAVVTLSAMNPFRTGQLVLFEVTYDTTWHFFELPFYAILGVFGGVYGIVVSRLNKRVAGFRKRYLAHWAVQEVLFLAVFSAALCYFNDYLRVDMTEAMQELFSECSAKSKGALCRPKSSSKLVGSLLLATVMRSCLTIVTYGCKVPAGIFVPSMAAGATFGRVLGILVEKSYQRFGDSAFFGSCPDDGPCVIAGTYALIGAGAALSGITHLTVTVAVIMFELTGAVKYIIPTMVAVTVTKIINDKWGHGGIADQMIVFNGLPFIDSKEEFIFGTSVKSAMSPATVVFTMETYSVGRVRDILTACPYRGFPLVQSQEMPTICGYVKREDVEALLYGHSDREMCRFLGARGSTENGTRENGSTENGTTENGTKENGTTENGTKENRSTKNRSTENRSTENRSTENRSTNGSTENRYTEIGMASTAGLRESGSSEELADSVLDLTKAVNLAPLVVDIHTTLEYLMDIFIKLGPRHVLVQKNDVLAGAITRKDILRYEHTRHELSHPYVDDGRDQKVWEFLQRILRMGEWRRL